MRQLWAWWRGLPWWQNLLAVLAVLVVIALMSPRTHDAITAKVMCEGFVEDRLRAPATADFASITETQVDTVDADAGVYEVRSHVDAQNAFGAMIRNSYTCRVRWRGDGRWVLENLEIK